MPIGLVGTIAAGAVAKAAGVSAAQLRTPEQNNAIRFAMIDAAGQAALRGDKVLAVTNPSGKRESGAPVELLTHWASAMATAVAKTYAQQVLAAVEGNIGGGGTLVKAGTPGTGAVELVGAKKKKAATRTTSAKKPKAPSRGRQQVRYNPDTGEKGKFYPDEPEYDAWPNRKPRSLTSSRGRRTEAGRQVDRLASTFTREAIKTGLKLTSAAATGLAGIASAAGLSVAAVVGIVAAAGAASFFGTSWVIKKLGEAKARRASGSDLALAYRQARSDYERKVYGRVGSPPGTLLNKTEHATLAALFKRALADRGLPSYNPPKGA